MHRFGGKGKVHRAGTTKFVLLAGLGIAVKDGISSGKAFRGFGVMVVHHGEEGRLGLLDKEFLGVRWIGVDLLATEDAKAKVFFGNLVVGHRTS